MNCELMDKWELLFDKYKIKPLLGVIPANKDPELLTYPKTFNIDNAYVSNFYILKKVR